MPIQVKKIKGHEYLYFQDSITLNSKTKVFSTLFGRKDNEKDLKKNFYDRSKKHNDKILKWRMEIDNYHFESKYTIDFKALEAVKHYYNFLFDTLNNIEKKEFGESFFIRYVFGTTAIEGNTYTENETGKLLVDELTTNNKTLNEANEIINYKDVREFINQYDDRPITQQFIKNINKILMKGIRRVNKEPFNAGEYRTSNVRLWGTEFRPCPPELIEFKIKSIIDEYEHGLKNKVHPIELAAIFHQKFEEIHPFEDGNGRTGRELLNYMLKQNGFPPIYIMPRHRSDYLNALEAGNSENFVPLIEFIINRIGATFLYILSKNSWFRELLKENTEFINGINDDRLNTMVSGILQLSKLKDPP
jgi:Fic family protein